MAGVSSKKNSHKRGQVRDIALKTPKIEEAFTVHRIQSEENPEVEPLENEYEEDQMEEDQMDFSAPVEEEELPQRFHERTQDDFSTKEAKDFVKVKFSKFVQLVASHELEEVMRNNEDEDVVLSSNLLTELAGAHDDEREGRKTPIILLVGLAMGFVLAYILFNNW